MRKPRHLVAVFVLLAFCFRAECLDFGHVNRLMGDPSRYRELVGVLEGMIPQAESDAERSQVMCRLSCVCMLCGEQAASVPEKKDFYSKGISWAEQAGKLDPRNPDCFMWHCANVGRNCQLQSLKEQIAAVPVMTGDLNVILEKLSRTDYSAAWQALAEIYINHPFKSNDSALNFMRMSLLTIPSGELRLSSYIVYAGWLEKRGLSAKKREDNMNDAFKKKEFKTNTDKCAERGGASDPRWSAPWTKGAPIASITDKEEALMVLEYAITLYERKRDRSALDTKDFAELQKAIKEIKD